MSEEIEVITDVNGLRERVTQARTVGSLVGLVPTMGALHAGHVSLAKRCNVECQFSVATIFVNPTQFAAGEDLEKYPRTLVEDCRQLQEAGVDVVFAPNNEIMYPSATRLRYNRPILPKIWKENFVPRIFRVSARSC